MPGLRRIGVRSCLSLGTATKRHSHSAQLFWLNIRFLSVLTSWHSLEAEEKERGSKCSMPPLRAYVGNMMIAHMPKGAHGMANPVCKVTENEP